MNRPIAKKPALVEAVRKAATPDAVRALLFAWRGKVRHAMEIIAEHARAWDDALVQLILVDDHGVRFLGANRHRPANTDELIARWSAARLMSEDTLNTLEVAVARLENLVRQGRLAIDGPICRDLMASTRPRSASMANRQAQTVRFLLKHPECTTETLAEILDLVGERLAPELVAPIVQHPRATCEIRKRAMLESIRPDQYLGSATDALAESDEVRLDPVLRAPLVAAALRLRKPRVRYLLISDAQAADCAELFRKHAQDDRAAAGQLLAHAGEKVAPLLSRDDITPFLEHAAREIRAGAIAALALVPESPEPEPPRPRRP